MYVYMYMCVCVYIFPTHIQASLLSGKLNIQGKCGTWLTRKIIAGILKKSHLGIYGNVIYSQLFITHLFK